ncbi:hypothetical protein TanjilG_28182 [Lupinus angustifolius]|uniref:SET domain-containing protein n=1 Tax=Lupinus angustifolius TaxID=3871 RepID=A0A4P1REK9_LUPAN|nr:PREDICTED: histone-lysine N-methyltransferase family member SUVH9-like [Lupinus angustifolius]OIW09583.1 hypothetical protein TanjilG_28182 [Lupinus angustifolius]
MDSIQTPNNPTTTFLPPPPGLHIPTTTTAVAATSSGGGVSIPSLKVPKPEPFDDSDVEKQLQLYSDFCRVSNLFREAFGNVDFPGDLDSELVDVKVSISDPNGVVDLNLPAPNSQPEEEISGFLDPDSGAIVPVPPNQEIAVTTPRRKQSRVKELVRVMDLGLKDQVHFREVVRKTRMVYESLRVLTSVEEEKRVVAAAEEEKRMLAAMAAAAAASAAAAAASAAAASSADGVAAGIGMPEGSGSNGSRTYRRLRLRGDLRAASLMRDQGLWLNRDKRIVGATPGIYVGDIFLFRMELCVLGLHGQIQAGIDYLPGSMSSNGEPIATSVIVSGGYEDDLDDGEVIVYTGQGGQEKNSFRQASHQKLEGGNLALERSMHYGIEVRVIRGVRYEGSASSSGKVYVYDGLYKIVDCWFDVGKSGFGVFKYKLWRIEGQEKMGSAILKEARAIRRSGFDFKPMYCLSVDISNRKENVPVRLFNDIDDNQDPLCFEYLTRTTFPQFVFHQSGKATGCDCVDGCTDGCFCFMKNGGEFPYNQHGILVRGKPLIFECGPFCGCPPHCRNRVTQKGLKNRLEVFRSRQTGWGVRSLDLIQAGAFICEYAGVVLTKEQAQILTMSGGDSSIHPNQFSDRWAEWGDISQVYSDYVRPSYPSVPPLDFSLDVSTMRNVACYMSHSSTPNVFVQFVLYDHNNLMFPHAMVFAMENIPPMRELSLDYGVPDEWTGKLSICN